MLRYVPTTPRTLTHSPSTRPSPVMAQEGWTYTAGPAPRCQGGEAGNLLHAHGLREVRLVGVHLIGG